MDGLALTEEEVPTGLDTILQRLAPRWFVVRDAHQSSLPVLLHPRQTVTLMRGPMTRKEIREARELREDGDVAEAAE